jgi:hypothetical protein
MILLVNVFLTARRVTSFDRGRLADVDALAAFRLMLRGLSDVRFSRAFVFAELDADAYGPADAALLAREVERVFDGTPLEFRPRRLLRMDDWRRFIESRLPADGPPVFYTGNHDHVFMDRDTSVLDACLADVAQLAAAHGRASLIVSHWAEYFSFRARLQRHAPHGFVHTSTYRDALQVLTPSLLREWVLVDGAALPGDAPIRRTEDIGWAGARPFPQVIPGRELFRHLDAGSHYGVRIRSVPPLPVPPGLLEGRLRIACLNVPDLQALRRYRAEGWCCVSPWFPSVATDADGVDFHWLADELPAYLRREAVELVEHGIADATAIEARDRRCAAMLDDLLPMPPATLARLAPHAIRTPVAGTPPRLAEPLPRPRRTEGLFALKTPVEHRDAAVVVIGTAGEVPVPAFWQGLDTSRLQPVYVWRQERRDSGWHVPASAVLMAGALHPRLAGLYSYLFDFASNAVTPLRELLHELACDTVVVVEPEALALPGVADWVAARPGRGPALLLGERDGHPAIVGLSVGHAWLAALLAHHPGLFCDEAMSLPELLLATAQHAGEMPRLDIARQRLDGSAVRAAPIPLLH